jgi:hypothetical protein
VVVNFFNLVSCTDCVHHNRVEGFAELLNYKQFTMEWNDDYMGGGWAETWPEPPDTSARIHWYSESYPGCNVESSDSPSRSKSVYVRVWYDAASGTWGVWAAADVGPIHWELFSGTGTNHHPALCYSIYQDSNRACDASVRDFTMYPASGGYAMVYRGYR